MPIEAPFASLGDIDSYADGLLWAHNKFNVSINIEIFDKYGDKVGSIHAESSVTQ